MKPRHGDTVVVVIPAQRLRRRWCEYCHVWTWASGRSEVFRHRKGTRTPECRRKTRYPLPPEETP